MKIQTRAARLYLNVSGSVSDRADSTRMEGAPDHLIRVALGIVCTEGARPMAEDARYLPQLVPQAHGPIHFD